MERRYEIHNHQASEQMCYLPKEMQRRAARIKRIFHRDERKQQSLSLPSPKLGLEEERIKSGTNKISQFTGYIFVSFSFLERVGYCLLRTQRETQFL